mgnify:CR=1 FL=1
MPSAFEKQKRKSLRQRWKAGEIEVAHWFERDRMFLAIQESMTGEYLAEWWDEDIEGLVEAGYLYVPSFIRIPSEVRKMEESVIKYAEEMGIKAYKGRAS